MTKADPLVLRARWIPTDESLRAIERFDEFCAARRELLAGALKAVGALARARTRKPGVPMLVEPYGQIIPHFQSLRQTPARPRVRPTMMFLARLGA
jgi:hypothetical protein